MPKQSKQIIGSFVFRNEGDGCLTSKYHHGDSTEGPFTEACKLISSINKKDVFVGTYQTVWLEDNNKYVPADLKIERPPNSRIYKIFWHIPNTNTLIFEGTAMMFDNLLIGTYWS